MTPKDDERVSIPLRMLDGNIKVLLENQIAVGTISMKHDPESAEGVLLLVQWANEEQEAAANAVGFRTKRSVGGVVIDE